jgi:hypothetical protein
VHGALVHTLLHTGDNFTAQGFEAVLEYLYTGLIAHASTGGMHCGLANAALQAAQFFCLDSMRASIWRWSKACQQHCADAPKDKSDDAWQYYDEDDYGSPHTEWLDPVEAYCS